MWKSIENFLSAVDQSKLLAPLMIIIVSAALEMVVVIEKSFNFQL